MAKRETGYIWLEAVYTATGESIKATLALDEIRMKPLDGNKALFKEFASRPRWEEIEILKMVKL